ncbi:hypothetical protein [uncultured Draconibacterium sp.]|uniref:hypothetical protein n=1 Tax=uncultured Draconibacterium sp. TaxID=1573823 RepID=UPI002AA66B11|nr:hypothetical protein [uncultured Draconibacterium sp.]
MNPLAIIGAFIISLSFLAYGIGSISLVRFKSIGRIVVVSLTMGVLFDLTAITLMSIGAGGTPYTLHGLVGAVAFLVMLVDTIWVWVVIVRRGRDSKAQKEHILYTKIAYLFWVIAYFAGSIIVIWR